MSLSYNVFSLVTFWECRNLPWNTILKLRGTSHFFRRWDLGDLTSTLIFNPPKKVREWDPKRIHERERLARSRQRRLINMILRIQQGRWHSVAPFFGWFWSVISFRPWPLIVDDCWICALLVVLWMSKHGHLPHFPKTGLVPGRGFFPNFTNSSQFLFVTVCWGSKIWKPQIDSIVPSVTKRPETQKSQSPRPFEASLQLGFRWRKWFLGLALIGERRARIVYNTSETHR